MVPLPVNCFNCTEPAEFVPRVKRGPRDWVTYSELCCCENCEPIAAAEIAQRAGSGHATQMIPFPATPYQREAVLEPERYAARLRQRKLARPALEMPAPSGRIFAPPVRRQDP